MVIVMSKKNNNKVNLTDRFIKSIKHPSEYSDEKATGLRLRVYKSGKKVFSYIYRYNKIQYRITFGIYPYISLAEARERVYDLMKGIRAGINPKSSAYDLGFYKSEDESEKIEVLLRIVTEEHLKKNVESWKKYKTAYDRFNKAYPDIYMRDINPKLLYKYFNDVAPDKRHYSGYNFSTKSVANHDFSYMRSAFKRLLTMGEISINPMQNIKKPFPEVGSVPKDRVLSDEELRRFINAVMNMEEVHKHKYLTLLLTGQRIIEMRKMQWKDLDIDDDGFQTWTIPAKVTKMRNRKHIVPLPHQLITILKNKKRVGEYVFSKKGNKPLPVTPKKVINTLKAMSGINDFKDDLIRKTVSTNLAKLGVEPIVISALHNHADGKKGRATKFYNRHNYVPELQKALQMYANWIEKLIKKEIN